MSHVDEERNHGSLIKESPDQYASLPTHELLVITVFYIFRTNYSIMAHCLIYKYVTVQSLNLVI